VKNEPLESLDISSIVDLFDPNKLAIAEPAAEPHSNVQDLLRGLMAVDAMHRAREMVFSVDHFQDIEGRDLERFQQQLEAAPRISLPTALMAYGTWIPSTFTM
jgi:hypothetical protein